MDKKSNYFNIKGWLIGLDFVIWSVASVLCVMWRWVADKSMVWSYMLLFAGMFAVWCVVGVLCGKYRPMRITRFLYQVLSLMATILIMYLVVYICRTHLEEWQYSPRVAQWMIWLVAGMDVMVLLGNSMWKYAQDMDDKPMIFEEREEANVLREPQKLSERALKSVEDGIRDYTNDEVLKLLRAKANIDSANTRVIANRDLFTVQTLEQYRFDTIVNLVLVNDIREINKHFATANDKLPDNGRFVCCFRPKEAVKEKILSNYPKGINWLVYSMHFVFKRMMPKLVLTSHLYFDLTDGRNRVLTETEVLGRLYFCGFEVDEVVEVGRMKYVFARRVAMPQQQGEIRKRYGPLIKLRRVGKDGRWFNVYKLRTMHPYSEYLQQYMLDNYGLQEGGKFANDVRVTTLGAFARKYWLDELPMFINFFKGDMKFVGVRPLSRQYFSLYTPDLQEKRTKFKPGLFPPFYADMPKTLDDIQDSEMRYLTMCEEKGCFYTDIYYMWRIFVNIVFKKARSH